MSYSSKDRPFVQRWPADLEARGVKLWWDRHQQDGIKPAEDWERKLRAKLDEITHFVSLLTPNSVESNMVRAELQIASSYSPKKILIPVLVQTLKLNTMPMQLVPLQYIDFTDPAVYTARVDELTQILR
ncbi:toll/interleukin-1 receptor domain-containing protein [Candidatus Flexifilum breve]|uniref:toll/interleukin-1 receptor domain-containing protein n=1 Tax=Candidatus Flexifilum breve TaxID=3140694 RepID=UPI0031CC689E